ncbi:vacuolar protein sorting 16 [Arctopsyche grandis]|uniref:vacuolar protein sorting 16 n=1 Tax=Arctopsyche grandis TaxID=121162 RepID=UPI00406D7CDC
MSAILIADWFCLDKDIYYRKFDLYSMNWNIDYELDTMVISGASYGGPIALIRDKKQLVRVIGQSKPVIHIYNCAGKHMSNIVWNNGNLVHIGWSDGEQLLCIQDSGDIFVYDMFGMHQHTFSMGAEARDTKVYKAKIFSSPHGTGIAIMTASNRMFLVNNVSEPKVRQLPDLPRATERPTSWCVLSSTTQVSGLLVCRNTDVFKCQLGEAQPIPLKADISNLYTAILKIVTSQNGRYVALFTDSGCIWMGTSDLKIKYCEIETGYLKKPKQIVWCGNEAVIGNWDNVMVILSKSGKSMSYSYDYPIHLIPEMDCVRVVSGLTHELIQKVPAVVQKIFRINSVEPGSYLLEASKQFQKRSHKADEYICLVKNQLSVAVQQCIDAAAFEFDPEIQKMLIRAAQFGKGFVPDHVPDHYVHTCRWLRVLNAVRDPKVAIPLTYLQVQHLSERILLDRLVWRRLHCLAKHIATYLKLTQGHTRVLAHWACYKVTQPHLDNESVAREIADKLRNVPGVSYTDIALKAADNGRQALAIKILEYEPLARKQVPLLLKLGEQKAALLKATQSGDTDLVFLVLLYLKEKMGSGDFLLIIRSFPLSQNLYMKYCAERNREALRKVYIQEDNFYGQAATYIKDALESRETMDASLNAAREAYKKEKYELGVSICEDVRKLIKDQASLRETHSWDLTSASHHDTINKLLSCGQVKLADKLKSEYKVPDRRYWWMRILILAQLGEWEELEKFSKFKKSPIGYEPFVDVCLKYSNKLQAQKYLPKCREDIKVKYYVKAEMYEEAAKIAKEQNDQSALSFIRSKLPEIQN